MKKLIFLFSILNVLIFNIVNAADIDAVVDQLDDMNFHGYDLDSFDMEEVNEYKHEQLYLAVIKNKTHDFIELIEEGADPLEATDIFTSEGWCPLSEVVRLDRAKMLEFLLDVNIKSKEANLCGINMRVAAIHWAIAHDKIDLAKTLAENISIQEIMDLDRYELMIKYIIMNHRKIDYKFAGQGLRFVAEFHEEATDLMESLIERVQKSLKSDAGDQKSQ